MQTSQNSDENKRLFGKECYSKYFSKEVSTKTELSKPWPFRRVFLKDWPWRLFNDTSVTVGKYTKYNEEQTCVMSWYNWNYGQNEIMAWK